MNTEHRKTPYWTDHCGHKPEDYVGSAEYMESTGELAKIDVYLYPDNVYRQGVCIRVSDEPSDYISPGGLLDFLRVAGGNYGAYNAAYEVLTRFARITATIMKDDSSSNV